MDHERVALRVRIALLQDDGAAPSIIDPMLKQVDALTKQIKR